MKQPQSTPDTALPAVKPQLQTLFRLIDDPDELIYSGISSRILEHGAHALPYIRVARETFPDDTLVQQRCDALEAIIHASLPRPAKPGRDDALKNILRLIKSFGGSQACMKILAEASYDYKPKTTTGLLSEYYSLITRRVILGDCWSIIYDLEKNEEPSELYTKNFIEDRDQYKIHDHAAEKLVDAVCQYLREKNGSDKETD